MTSEKENKEPKKPEFHFNTSSGIKSIVGKDLITDRYVAIFELVKNSYDAKASDVLVSFNTKTTKNKIDDLNSGEVIVYDNGTGMSKSDLQNKWLFLAYSDKKEGTETSDETPNIKKRVYVGSKGIGRFSCDSLGAKLVIKTKTKNDDIENQLTIEWDRFDDSLEQMFESIAVDYKENKTPSIKNQSSYTILEISNLRDDWDKEQIRKVVDKLKRLKNPFVEEDDLKIYCGINIFKNNIENLDKNDEVRSEIAKVLKEKSINIEARITKENITITLTDRGTHIYELEKSNDSILKNVNEIKIGINYLTTSAKATFTRRMGIEPVNYGNIFIYRNGFHVNPYGEPEVDIFGLNMRKTQGYNRYIATRELIGFISIADGENLFKETSSRNNGFIENGYFKALEDLYMSYIHRPLERYVTLIKWGEEKDTGNEVLIDSISLSKNEADNFKNYVGKNFTINSFNPNLNFEKNNPKKIIENLIDNLPENQKGKGKKLKKQVTELVNKQHKQEGIIQKKEATISNLQRQNKNLVTKRSENSYAEQITHHFNLLAERLDDAVSDLLPFKKNIPNNSIGEYLSALELVKATKSEIEIFRNLLLKTNYDIRSSEKLNWFDLAKWYFLDNGRNTYYKNFVTTCNIEGSLSNWDIYSSHIEILMMFDNFYKNAFEHRASYIDFLFSKNSLTISSNSTPINESTIDHIFDLGFSTKEAGTGIGLYQAKSYLGTLGFSIQVMGQQDVQFIINKG